MVITLNQVRACMSTNIETIQVPDNQLGIDGWHPGAERNCESCGELKIDLATKKYIFYVQLKVQKANIKCYSTYHALPGITDDISVREEVLVRFVLARDCLPVLASAHFGSGGGIGFRAVLVTKPFPGFFMVEVKVSSSEAIESFESS